MLQIYARFRRWLLLIVAVLIVGGLAAAVYAFAGGDRYRSGDADVRIDSHMLHCEAGGSVVYHCFLNGTVSNGGAGDAGYVVVEAEFLDDFGRKQGEGLDSIGDLRAGDMALYSIGYQSVECPVDFVVWAEWIDY